MALTILLTGFGPFPGAPSNPTGALVRQLACLRRPTLAHVRLVPHVFPTSYRAVDRDLPRLLTDLKPDAILMFGVSARVSCLRVETRARNALSALRDADGQRLGSPCILPGGPAALDFSIPAARLALAARSARVPAVTSRDAGRYLCNYLCWRAVEAASNGGPRLATFVHVPPVHPTVGRHRTPLTFDDLLRAGEAIVQAAAAAVR